MQLDSKEYTTDRFELSRHIDNLEGDWKAYIEVAQRFQYKVKAQDREDILSSWSLPRQRQGTVTSPFPKPGCIE
jgi:hypothetical protein